MTWSDDGLALRNPLTLAQQIESQRKLRSAVSPAKILHRSLRMCHLPPPYLGHGISFHAKTSVSLMLRVSLHLL